MEAQESELKESELTDLSFRSQHMACDSKSYVEDSGSSLTSGYSTCMEGRVDSFPT